MEITPDIPIANLRAGLNGNMIAPDDPGYDDARRVFFTGFDRRPAAIAELGSHGQPSVPARNGAPGSTGAKAC